MKQKFVVTGMTCSACSAHVEKAVRRLAGVQEVNVNLLGGSMEVDWEGELTSEQIIGAVKAAGYGASLPGGNGTAAAAPAAWPVSTQQDMLRKEQKANSSPEMQRPAARRLSTFWGTSAR